jgi:hypothetical protein
MREEHRSKIGMRANGVRSMRTLLGLTLSWTLFLPLLFSEVQQAHVDPRIVTLPISSGRDIRFKRLSTTEGLSQVKVGQVLQDDQGFMWFGTQYPPVCSQSEGSVELE